MSEAKAIDWKTNYAACFKPLADKQEAAMEQFLAKNVSELSQQELDRGVANLCDTWDVPFMKRSPNVNDIMVRILTLRKRRGAATAERIGVPLSVLETSLRDRIRATDDPLERFNHVCRGDSSDMCQRLEHFASNLPGGVERPSLESIRSMVGGLADELHARSKEIKATEDL